MTRFAQEAKMTTTAGSKAKPQFVATIDFGTTHCSVAYVLRPDLEGKKVDPTLLNLDEYEKNRRVLSCILFDSNGKMIAIGPKARERYAALKPEQKPQSIYFEHVKKHLQHEEVMPVHRTYVDMNIMPTPSPHPKNWERGLVTLANFPICAESAYYVTITCLT